jgi:hypothetical protein
LNPDFKRSNPDLSHHLLRKPKKATNNDRSFSSSPTSANVDRSNILPPGDGASLHNSFLSLPTDGGMVSSNAINDKTMGGSSTIQQGQRAAHAHEIAGFYGVDKKVRMSNNYYTSGIGNQQQLQQANTNNYLMEEKLEVPALRSNSQGGGHHPFESFEPRTIEEMIQSPTPSWNERSTGVEKQKPDDWWTSSGKLGS